MFARRIGSNKVTVIPEIGYVTINGLYDNTVVEGVGNNAYIAVSGGTPGYTFTLKQNGSVQGSIYQTGTSVNIGFNPYNYGSSNYLTVDVVDSKSKTKTSAQYPLSIYYNRGISLSINTGSTPHGSNGAVLNSYPQIASFDSSYSITYYYRISVNSGGSWSGWSAFSTTQNTFYGPFGAGTNAGEWYQHYCTLTTQGITTTSNTVQVNFT